MVPQSASMVVSNLKERKKGRASICNLASKSETFRVSQSVALELRLERTKTSRTSEDLKQVGRVRSEKCKQK